MSVYLFTDIPDYHLDDFVAVRNSYDNFLNVLTLVETVNRCGHCRTENEDEAVFAIFTGNTTRILIKKDLGFYTMCLPFQIIDFGGNISFNYDEYNMPITALFISIMRSCVEACRDYGYSHEDIIENIVVNYNIDVRAAVNYCDIFTSLMTEDHGYFRFDDDDKNKNGRIHPRYHFDFYYKNSSSIKIGVDRNIGFDFFKRLFDHTSERPYIK
ncbi:MULTISPECIES: hypothetical protein [Aeromonas]|uniref:hypothetical protein n=1 Tax=Aeromonas TaxID=642 RepID=UPI0015DCA20A|nr:MULTISPECIES: hypothetical protein [Aeromonas]MBL0525371.1 hypothetical protein [Aeromonas dhakensis]MBL0569849.1 hypothetical protein [Aeromonas hydrophila]MCR3946141.1 hypothetical protein [Aeromonas caviae]MDX7783995.1 hypothetical protein [Aeromonas caviae]QXB54723.1 hypothetical protein I6L45_19610 [Aeromonas sp. FDAARGOS 1415]